jgi:putative nucleotidyltransferase with HDIG domain
MAEIFILSDDRKETDKVFTALEREFSIESFTDIQEFLKHFFQTPPKLLILDHDFSGINIILLITKIKEKPQMKDLPVIVLTSPEKRNEIMDCIKMGVKDFLIKPYLTSVLLQKTKKNILGGGEGASGSSGTASAGELNVVAEERIKEGIYKEIENLPAFPLIVQKVIKIANDPNSAASDFENVVSKDQTLTAKMLKMANSPFYNVGRDIVVIKEAVVTLGYKTVKSLAFAAGAGQIFQKNLPQYGLAAGGLWKHSLGVAVTARLVGQELGFSDDMCEELFVCGLLHDIGKLVLGLFISRSDQVYMAPSSGENSICQIEKKLTGFDHTEVGEIIINKWQLPNIILSAVKYHHKPMETSYYNKEVAVVNMANYICDKNKVGFSMKNTSNPELLDSVKSELGLSEDKYQDILKKAEAQIGDIDRIASI